MRSTSKPVGTITRGTTHPNRLRRLDGWLIHRMAQRLRHDPEVLVVDLGFGATPATTLELADRLRAALNRPVPVVGIDIDPQRVRAALPQARDPVRFAVGGFEVPLPGSRPPTIVRAANVLRQYDEAEVRQVWQRLADRLADGGLFVDCTCDELGRVATWVAVGRDAAGRAQPETLTLSLRLAPALSYQPPIGPDVLAERLPKALIHRNVPGEPVHRLLHDLDRAWKAASPAFGPRQRWVGAASAMRLAGWPVRDGPSRWRLGELTVDWAAVAPA